MRRKSKRAALAAPSPGAKEVQKRKGAGTRKILESWAEELKRKEMRRGKKKTTGIVGPGGKKKMWKRGAVAE